MITEFLGIANRSALPIIQIKTKDMLPDEVTYYVDFRLEEIRPTNAPFLGIAFKDLPEEVKAQIRGIRTRHTSYGYIKGLDD